MKHGEYDLLIEMKADDRCCKYYAIVKFQLEHDPKSNKHYQLTHGPWLSKNGKENWVTNDIVLCFSIKITY